MILDSGISLALIVGFGVFSLLLGVRSRMQHPGESLLVADRQLSVSAMAFSIAATWVWAPALFVASEKAFTQGLAGVFWFTVPNVLCLMLFGWFMAKFIPTIPKGFTLSAWMREKRSPRVQKLYIIQTMGLTVCSIAVQLLAGGMVIATLTGISYTVVIVVIALVTLVYSAVGGIRASVMTDRVQMLVLLLLGVPIILWVVSVAGGSSVAAGIGGKSGTFSSPLNWLVISTFGIPTTIGLLAGPFGDQTFYQRAFSMNPKKIKKAFVWGAVLFGIVPVTFALLGFTAAGLKLDIGNTQITNILTVIAVLPDWVAYPFLVVLLAGLITTVDSMYVAAASFTGFDLSGRKENAGAARWGMVAVAVAGILIAMIPGLKVVYLFLLYGTLRSSTFLPTVLTFFGKSHERGMFYGILGALAIGLPVFAYGNFNNLAPWIITGSLLTIGLSGLGSWLIKERS